MIMSAINFLAGFVAGTAVILAIVFIPLFRKRALLQEMDFRLHRPDVPDTVLQVVRQAEVRYYRDLPVFRRMIEALQDVVALLWPRLAFASNISVGAYRIKPQTIHRLIDFALQNGYLEMRIPPDDRYDPLLAYFAMQPVLNDWQAGLLLQELKSSHPGTKNRSWRDIAVNPRLVAKLYSGYMGAGGDFEAWKRSDEPGAVSKQRLGYQPEDGSYTLIPV